MKTAKRPPAAKPGAPVAPARAKPPASAPRWPWVAVALAALIAVFEAYQPALNGPFLFDDRYLPFALPGFAEQPLRALITGVRPVLMFSFWTTYRAFGLDPYAFHAVNLLLHSGAALFVMLIARRLLSLAGESGLLRELLAVFAGALFLLHPAQTESVAYIASRSEALSVLFAYGALAIFVYQRRREISFKRSLTLLALFAAACLTKEHSLALAPALVLTDWFWNPPLAFRFDWFRRNWRLYVPAALAAIAALAFVLRALKPADTAGFGLQDLPWHQYFFTQCRAIWVYVRLFVLPVGQNVDYDFPLSRTPFEHGAIFGLAALVAVLFCAFRYRRRYPLACYGALLFLLLIAPTSSFAPIRDPLAERRLYLPFLGLALVSLEPLRRWKLGIPQLAAALAALLVIFSALTWERNHVWSSAIALWEDTVARSPAKARPHFQLAFAYVDAGQCAKGVTQYEAVARLQPADYRLLVDWGLALDCAGRPADALRKLEQALLFERSAHVYSQIGMVHAKAGERQQALAALDQAAQLDPRFAMTYVYRGNLFVASQEWDRAEADYSRALALDPGNFAAIQGLGIARRQRNAVPPPK